MTVFSTGLVSSSKEPQAAKAYIKFISSPAAAPVINKTGMEAMAK
jgi:molybdate transport system substrate-binding protein